MISVIDDKSDDAATTYTITAVIVNENHKPYFDPASETELDLGSWTIGHPSNPIPTIPTSLWKDDDPSDTLAFDSTSLAKCTIS